MSLSERHELFARKSIEHYGPELTETTRTVANQLIGNELLNAIGSIDLEYATMFAMGFVCEKLDEPYQQNRGHALLLRREALRALRYVAAKTLGDFPAFARNHERSPAAKEWVRTCTDEGSMLLTPIPDGCWDPNVWAKRHRALKAVPVPGEEDLAEAFSTLPFQICLLYWYGVAVHRQDKLIQKLYPTGFADFLKGL